jgi:hypothetical protein
MFSDLLLKWSKKDGFFTYARVNQLHDTLIREKESIFINNCKTRDKRGGIIKV